MKEKANLIDPHVLEILKQEFDTLTFQADFDLVYENQIPTTGVAILEGMVELTKGSKVRGKFSAGHLLGLTHLLDGTPVKFGYRIKAKSKVILIGKSKFIESSKKKAVLLKKLLKA